ncbi:peptidase S8/S53 domain-containing protein [Coemansia spiralis]|nr:peptidase S8/S53 domain-containing protein [Coemansia spiralis]
MRPFSFGGVLLATFIYIANAEFTSSHKLHKRIHVYPPYVQVKPRSYIVQFEDYLPPTHAGHFYSMPGVDVQHHYSNIFNGISVRTDCSADSTHLASVNGVKRVWPVRVYTAAGYSTGLNATYPYIHKPTGVERAIEELGLDGKGIHIGIVDTGVDYNHPELGNCWKTKGCMWQYGADLVGDKYNPYTENPIIVPKQTPMDCAGHGTHVSGIIAGQGPTVYGVARNVTLGMYRVFGCPGTDPGAGQTSDDFIIKGIEMAVADKSDIISLSLGGGSWSDGPSSIAASNAVKQGIVVVAAVGNDGTGGLHTVSAPAVGNGVLGVGSVDSWNYTVSMMMIVNEHTSQSVFITPSNTVGYPFIFETDTPVVSLVNNSDVEACVNITQDLTGIVAVFEITSNCSPLSTIASIAQAGAVGIILIYTKPGLTYPTLETGQIPLVVISSDNGQFLLDAIAQGPTTIKALKSNPTITIPADKGSGQISTFSSMGPDPNLGLSPHVMAPGGYIYSTFPLKFGSYFVLSGTSMATPYVSGAVALLKQARPNLTVKEIGEILLTTAHPIINSKTKKVEHPYKGGSGLINVYDAIKSRAKIDPPMLSLNSTTRGVITTYQDLSALGNVRWTVRTIKLTNMDVNNNMRIDIDYSISDSLSMYYKNGSIAYTPRVWTGNAITGGINNTEPVVYIPDAVKSIPSGKTGQYTVILVAPKGLAECEGWYFGGQLNFNLKWDGDLNITPYHVPFAGFNGDYTKLDVLAPLGSGFPFLGDENAKPVDPKNLVVSASNPISVYFSMALPSHLGILQLVDANNKKIGYLPQGYATDIPHTCPTCSVPNISVIVNGTVFTDTDLTNAIEAPAGKYYLHSAFLRPFGNTSNSDDYQTWDSPEFTIG